jgi:hypothetical protein
MKILFLQHSLIATGVVLLAFAVGMGFEVPQRQQAQAATNDSLFGPVADVLEHPRCMNCHPRSGRPLQTDTRRIHQQNVMRGMFDRGNVGLACASCHTTKNNTASGVPGAPNWHLPPVSMGWQGLSRAELCRALSDPAKNGNRSLADLVHHMSTDPLVLWGWKPGEGLEAVPVPHDEFVKQLEAWVAAGGPCPN